jgi:hypothetical protein
MGSRWPGRSLRTCPGAWWGALSPHEGAARLPRGPPAPGGHARPRSGASRAASGGPTWTWTPGAVGATDHHRDLAHRGREAGRGPPTGDPETARSRRTVYLDPGAVAVLRSHRRAMNGSASRWSLASPTTGSCSTTTTALRGARAPSRRRSTRRCPPRGCRASGSTTCATCHPASSPTPWPPSRRSFGVGAEDRLSSLGLQLDGERFRRSQGWARVGSNHRPRDYESPALTTELRAPTTTAGPGCGPGGLIECFVSLLRGWGSNPRQTG